MADTDYPKVVDELDLSDEQKGALDAFKAAADAFSTQRHQLLARARDLEAAGIDPEPLVGDAIVGDGHPSAVYMWLSSRDERRKAVAWHDAFNALAEETKTVLRGLSASERRAAREVMSLTRDIGPPDRPRTTTREQLKERLMAAQHRLSEETATLLTRLSDAEREALSVVVREEPQSFVARRKFLRRAGFA